MGVYRTESYNSKVGGADKSYHLYGSAADIRIDGVTPLMIAAYVEGLGVKGIGMYDTFVHVDTRTSNYFWVNRSGNRVSTFGGSKSMGQKPDTGIILKKGSRGEAVKWLQERLNIRGASLTVDGIFGEKTYMAVVEYQKSVGIKVDGIAGDITIGYLSV